MEADPEKEIAVETSAPSGTNLALALVVISWCAWTIFQTVQLVRERNHLTELKANQESALQEASKVKTQIEAITLDTAKLAAAGNPGAKRIVAEFKRRGFKVNGASDPAPTK